jgi:ribonuclease HI
MELTAAINGLSELKVPCRVKLYTDSKYLLLAFTDGWLKKWQANGWRTASRKSVLNADHWKKLLELTTTHDVEWHWVRGHSDDVENARCDQLAVEARERLSQVIRQRG